MVSHHLAITLYKDVLALFCAASLAISTPSPHENSLRHCEGTIVPEAISKIEIASLPSVVRNDMDKIDYMNTMLWPYLRKGINYLEASGKEVPTYFMHSGA